MRCCLFLLRTYNCPLPQVTTKGSDKLTVGALRVSFSCNAGHVFNLIMSETHHQLKVLRQSSVIVTSDVITLRHLKLNHNKN